LNAEGRHEDGRPTDTGTVLDRSAGRSRLPLLRDLDHAAERARAHGLRVEFLPRGAAAIGCPCCGQGQELLLVMLGGVVTVESITCNRCHADSLAVNAELLAEPAAVSNRRLLDRLRRDLDLLAERLGAA
jgi:hypothetical protein